MKVTITIDCDNAAFAVAEDEVSRILTDLAEKISGADFSEPYDRRLDLRDLNGNKVGEFEVKA